MKKPEANKGKGLGGSGAAADAVMDELGAASGTIRLPHLAKGTAKSRATDIMNIIDTNIPDKPTETTNKALKVIPKNIETMDGFKKPILEAKTESIREGKTPSVDELPETKAQDKSKIEREADKITETKSLVPHHAKGSHTIRSDIMDNKLSLGGMALGRALFGYLTFGPWGAILSPAIQFGTDLLMESQSLREALFGKLVNGKRDDSGLISAGIVDAVQKHFPTIAKSGMLGMVSSMMMPFGPVAGLFLGAGLGFLKSNEEFRNKLLGGLGIDEKKRKWLAEHAVAGRRGAAIGAISTLFGGPFGLLGNAAVGAGLGMLASSDTFKDALLGKKDKFGVRHGGVVGGFKEAFKDAIMTPLKQIWHPLKRSVIDLATWIPRHFMKRFGDNVRGGFRYAFGAFGEGLKGVAKSIADHLPKGLRDALSGFTKSLGGWLKKSIFGDITFKDIGKTLFNTAFGGGLGGLAGWMLGGNPLIGALIGEGATALPGVLARIGNAATRKQSQSFNTLGQTAGEIAKIQNGEGTTAQTYQALADIEANKAGNKKEAAKSILKYQEERTKLLDTKRKEKIAEDLQMRKTLEEAGLSDLAIYQLIMKKINKGQELTEEDLYGRIENGVRYDSAISANLRDLQSTLSEDQFKTLQDTLTQAVNQGAQRRRELDAIKSGTSTEMQKLREQYGSDLKSLGLTDEQLLDEEVMKNLAKVTESSLALSDKNLTIEQEALEVAKKQEKYLENINDFLQYMENTGITANLDEEALMRIWKKFYGNKRMGEMVKQGEAELGKTSNAAESIFDTLTDTDATPIRTKSPEDIVAEEMGEAASGTIRLPRLAKGTMTKEDVIKTSTLTSSPKDLIQHHFLGSLISGALGLGKGLWDFATGLFQPTGKIKKSKLVEQKEAQAGLPPANAGAAPISSGTVSLANSDVDKSGDNKTVVMDQEGPITLVDNGDGLKPNTDDSTRETLNKKAKAQKIRDKVNEATIAMSSFLGKAFGTGSDAEQKKGKGLGWLGSLLLGGALWKSGILSKAWDGIKPWLLGTAIPKVGEYIGKGATMAVDGIARALPGILEGTVNMLINMLPSVLKGAYEGVKGIATGVVNGVENIFFGGNKRDKETHQSIVADATGAEREMGTESGYYSKEGKPLTYKEVKEMADKVQDGEYIEAYTSGGYQLKRDGTDTKGNPEVNHDMAGYTGERLLYGAANNAKNVSFNMLNKFGWGSWIAAKTSAGFTRVANAAARAGKHRILLKAFTKPVEWGSKIMARVADPVHTASGFTGWLIKAMEKMFNNGAMKWILNKVSFSGKLGDKIADWVVHFTTKMSEKAVAKAGISKVTSAIARYAPLIGQALFMSDLLTGYNEAEYIMNVTNPTSTQCVAAALARAFSNLSVIFAIWPGETEVAQDFYKFLLKVSGKDEELAKYEKEIADTQAEYEAYKAAGGDLEKDDWLSRKSTWGSFKGWWVDLFRGDWNKGPDIASKVAQFRWKFTAHIKSDKDFLATYKIYTDWNNAKQLLQLALGNNPIAAEIYIRLCVIFKADITTGKPLSPSDYDEMYKVYKDKVLSVAEGRSEEELKYDGIDMSDSLAHSLLIDQNANGTTTNEKGQTVLTPRDQTNDTHSIKSAAEVIEKENRNEQAYGKDRTVAGSQVDYSQKMLGFQPEEMKAYYLSALNNKNLLRENGEATPKDLQFFKFLYDAQSLKVLDKHIPLESLIAHVDELFNHLNDGVKEAIKIRLQNIYNGDPGEPGNFPIIYVTDTDDHEKIRKETGWSPDPTKILSKAEEPTKPKVEPKYGKAPVESLASIPGYAKPTSYNQNAPSPYISIRHPNPQGYKPSEIETTVVPDFTEPEYDPLVQYLKSEPTNTAMPKKPVVPETTIEQPKPVISEQPKPVPTVAAIPEKVDTAPKKPIKVPPTVPEPINTDKVKSYPGLILNKIPVQAVYADTFADAEEVADTTKYPPLTAIFTKQGIRGASVNAAYEALEGYTKNTALRRSTAVQYADPTFIELQTKRYARNKARMGKGRLHGLFGRGTIDEEFAKLSPDITSYASMAVGMIPESALSEIKNASLKSLIITAAGALVAFIDKLFTSSFLVNSLKSVIRWLGSTNAAHSIETLCTTIKNLLIPAFQAKLAKLSETQIMKMIARIQPITKIAFAVWDAIDGIDRAEAIVGVVDPSPLDHIIAAISQFLLGQFAGGLLYYVLGTEYTVQMIYKAAAMVFDMDEYKKKYIETERLYQEFKSQPGNENISKTDWLTQEYSYWGSFLKVFSNPDLQAFEHLLALKVDPTKKQGLNGDKRIQAHISPQTYRRSAMESINKPTEKPSGITAITDAFRTGFDDELNKMMNVKTPSVKQSESAATSETPTPQPAPGAAKGTAKKKHKPAKINLVPSKFGKGFAKQIDPAIADMPYNIDGDSMAQTYYDSACGPVTAVNMLESITGRSLGSEAVIDAGSAALTGGYKEIDGGTDPRFHQDYLKQYGIDTELSSSKQKIADNIEKGPTTLMIEEPISKNRHYIETEGVTPDGLVSVNDPENPQDGVLYDKKSLIDQSLVGITAKGTTKKKKPARFGRGYTPNQTDISRAVMIRNILRQKGYSDNAIYGILANMEVESAWHFNPKQVEFQLLKEIKDSGKTFGMTKIDNESYTNAVDTGAIDKQEFIYPSVGSDAGKARRGYGLVQFTSADKKGLLYDSTVGKGKSIGDLGLQVETFDSYIAKYKKDLYAALHDPNITPTKAAEEMLSKYEIPSPRVWDSTSKQRRERSLMWQH